MWDTMSLTWNMDYIEKWTQVLLDTACAVCLAVKQIAPRVIIIKFSWTYWKQTKKQNKVRVKTEKSELESSRFVHM